MGRERQREETGRPERRKRCSEKERRQKARSEQTAGGAQQPEEYEDPGEG